MLKVESKGVPCRGHQSRVWLRLPLETHRDGGVDVVLSSSAVRGQEGDKFIGQETGVQHAQEDLVDRVERLRDGQIGSRASDVRAASQELEARATSTVADTDCTSKLDATAQ